MEHSPLTYVIMDIKGVEVKREMIGEQALCAQGTVKTLRRTVFLPDRTH